MMDLKSMLNDSASQRPPRLQTSQSSHETQHAIPSDVNIARASSHPAMAHPPDSRQHPGNPFPYQSPRQTHLAIGSSNADTPSGHPQSPGTHAQGYISRENGGMQYPYNGVGVTPSPSASTHQPPTPSGSRQYQTHTPGSVQSQHSQSSHIARSQSPHASAPINGHEQAHVQRMSQPAQMQQHPQPQTPLGPPVVYNRVSPQVQRPTSQGPDQHYRRSSHGSTGSGHGREHPHATPRKTDSVENLRNQSAQRYTAPEVDRLRDRDRSLSVSPKTIPKPSPFRQLSSTSVTSSLSQQDLRSVTTSHHPQERIPDYPNSTPTPNTSVHSVEPGHTSRGASAGPTSNSLTYGQLNPTLMASPSSMNQDLPVNRPTPTLKRNASLMSDGSGILHQPRKRLRRDEIPHWAQSARRRMPRFGDGSKKARFAPASTPAPAPTPARQALPQAAARPAEPFAVNGHAAGEPNPKEQSVALETKWEPTIANTVPADDLSTAISHWIHSHIGNQVPPAGSVFEIEAKVGAICDTHTGDRIRLPVRSETITAVDLPHTKFESSMDMEQHQKLNQYLNGLAQNAYNDPNREPVRFCHLRQLDDFFELTPEGLSHLNPALMSNKGRRPRVRKTTDKETGQIRAMIIKVRIDDLEVYNPVHDFDYRISISIESPWEGDPAWLIPMQNANSRTRLKDRMSYRHGAIQVDLTQVSHEDSQKMEHELEVEVSVAMLQAELEKERTGFPSRFNDLVKSLVDNARLLCRQGSLYRRG